MCVMNMKMCLAISVTAYDVMLYFKSIKTGVNETMFGCFICSAQNCLPMHMTRVALLDR